MTSDPTQMDMLSIQLSQRTAGAPFDVDSVDIVQPSFRHRLSFTREKEIQNILCHSLARYAYSVLDRLDRDTMVLSEPDAVVELPGLVLGKLRVLSHGNSRGGRQVIIRFAYFIGGVQAAFRVSTHFDLPTVSHREALAVAALHDICIPVFDVVSSAIAGLFDDHVGQTSAGERLARLSGVESDLLFYLQLLKRYVSATSSDQIESERSRVVALPAAERAKAV